MIENSALDGSQSYPFDFIKCLDNQSINQSIMDHLGRLEACFVFFLAESQRPGMILGQSGSFPDCPSHEDIYASGSTRSLCSEGLSIQCT
jgi:hypothetical protein